MVGTAVHYFLNMSQASNQGHNACNPIVFRRVVATLSTIYLGAIWYGILLNTFKMFP